VCFSATLGGELTEVITTELRQEDDLVAQQGKVMGNIAPYPTRCEAHRARVGVTRHESVEARGNDIGIRSANYADSHGVVFLLQLLLLGQKYKKV
jgi:hypothetical protein